MMVKFLGQLIFIFALLVFTANDWLNHNALKQILSEEILKQSASYGLKNLEIETFKRNQITLKNIRLDTLFTPVAIDRVTISFTPQEIAVFMLAKYFNKTASLPSLTFSHFEIELKQNRRVQATPSTETNAIELTPQKLRLSDILSFFDLKTELIDGWVEGNFTLKPFSNGPIIEGTATLTDADFAIEPIGLKVEGLTANIHLTESGFTLLDVKDKNHWISSGRGHFEFSAERKFPYELDLRFDHAQLLNKEPLVAIGSGNMRLKGDLDAAWLSGKVEADHLLYTLKESEAQTAPPLNVRFIHKEKVEPYPVYFDLELEIPAIAKAKSKELTSTWGGELHLIGSAFSPVLKGELKLHEGQYLFNGRPIPLTEGKLFFDGDWLKKTTLYVIAEMDLKKIVAEIIVKGSITNPELTLRSNPPLSEKEILSWILFNKGLDTISSFQGSELGRSLQIMKHMKSGKDPLAEIRQTLGIDRIDLDRRETLDGSEVSLQVGKYLTKGLYIGLSRAINTNTHRLGLEAELAKNVKLQAEIGDDSQGQLHLKWKKDY